MTASILILSNLAQRRDWLIQRLIFLGQNGHEGEIIVGVWGGHEQMSFVEEACRPFLGKSRLIMLAQDGELFVTDRMLELAQRATSPFVAAQGDDDFFFPAAVAKSAEILANDPSVLCAQGRCLNLNLTVYPASLKFGFFPVWEALEDDTVERYCNLMKHYSFTWHAVYRQTEFIERIKIMELVKNNTDDLIFFEIIGDLYSVIKGKVFIFDEMYIVRGEHENNGAKLYRRGGIKYDMPPYMLLSPAFTASYKYFEEKFLQLFASVGVDTASEDVLRKILDGMMSCLGRLFYKIRDRHDAGELEFQAKVRASAPEISSSLKMIRASHDVAQRAIAQGTAPVIIIGAQTS